MKNRHETSRRAVLIASAVVLMLAGSLAVRVTARAVARPVPVPAPAEVPPPTPLAVADLPTPFCWGCAENQNVPLDFQIDLDLLAPLGDGTANAAEWFADFAVGHPRHAEWSDRRTEAQVDGRSWWVLAADDPLLLEAERWVDQARCRFHPELFPIDGVETELPNLLMMLDLSRSWAARGKLLADPVAARDDFRRAIRLGRLLRQDDVTLIQDLVAIACIRIGAEGLYELARQEGDAPTMVATSLVLADKDAIRLSTMRRMSVLEQAVPVRVPETRQLELRLTDDQFDRILDLMDELEERRFRIEGAIGLQAVLHLGSEAQRTRARTMLDKLAAGSDELLAKAARQLRDGPFDAEAYLGTE